MASSLPSFTCPHCHIIQNDRHQKQCTSCGRPIIRHHPLQLYLEEAPQPPRQLKPPRPFVVRRGGGFN